MTLVLVDTLSSAHPDPLADLLIVLFGVPMAAVTAWGTARAAWVWVRG